MKSNVLQCVSYKHYGWNGNITQQMIDYSNTKTISQSWKDIFQLYKNILKKVMIRFCGLQGWRVFLSFGKTIYMFIQNGC